MVSLIPSHTPNLSKTEFHRLLNEEKRKRPFKPEYIGKCNPYNHFVITCEDDYYTYLCEYVFKHYYEQKYECGLESLKKKSAAAEDLVQREYNMKISKIQRIYTNEKRSYEMYLKAHYKHRLIFARVLCVVFFISTVISLLYFTQHVLPEKEAQAQLYAQVRYEDGYDKGNSAGYNIGKNEGYEDGKEDGFQTGYATGRDSVETEITLSPGSSSSGTGGGYDSSIDRSVFDDKDNLIPDYPDDGNSETVFVTASGSKYHRVNCSYLKTAYEISLSEAIAAGYEPCSRCHPPTE